MHRLLLRNPEFKTKKAVVGIALHIFTHEAFASLDLCHLKIGSVCACVLKGWLCLKLSELQ